VKTTLLIPCYNEAEGIPQLCARLRLLIPRLQKESNVEVIFVNDGSTDGTADVIKREAVDLPFRIVTHDFNKGLGAALRTGFAASTGDEIVTLDSDCTYDPIQAVELLSVLRSGADVVTGSPYHPQGESGGASGWRLLLSKSLSRFYWLILPRRLYTYTSCFRAYRRDIVRQLEIEDNGFLFVTKLLVTAILEGAKVAEVPARLTSRRFGRSKLRVLRVMLSHLKYLLQVIWLRLTGTRRLSVRSVQEVASTTTFMNGGKSS
jgi:dolichol-phosphate mannosyltransferase